TEPTSPQRDQEHRGVTSTELLNRFPTISCRAIQIRVVNIALIQLLAESSKEGRELRKDQHTVTLRQNLSQPRHQLIQLRRRHMRVLVINNRRIQRQHPEQRQRAENRNPVGIHIRYEIQHILPLALQNLLIQLLVLPLHLHLEHHFLLLRKFGGNRFFCTTQHERPNLRPQ